MGARLFIVCTPRTGNTWLRKLLAGNLDLAEHPAHALDELDWERLEPGFAISMHVHATPQLVAFLAARGVRVIVTVRHPLDVLISILAWTQHQRQTRRWVGGDGGDESSLFGATPTDRAFLDYALSERAGVLLGVSVEWLAHAAAVVRYEELVADTTGVLNALIASLGAPTERPISHVIAQNSMEKLRAIHTENAHHFWRGERGIWYRLLPREVADAIAQRHRAVFERLGYACDADPNLTSELAKKNWAALSVAPDEPATQSARPKFSLFRR
ncbi:MAG TPA: sulfotransferase domain-containing protein [Candidatus Acidoferrales bacterium]|nr:sulfotransferase domain-containing protein [Candidatus Acidoferrales bacterium]